MPRLLPAVALLLLVSRATAAPPDFDREVAPLLAARCLDCHSGPKPKGKLDLSRRDNLDAAESTTSGPVAQQRGRMAAARAQCFAARAEARVQVQREVLLKLEMLRQKRPMAEIVREAVQAYVSRERRAPPPGAGAFSSGHTDTADRAEDILAKTGFGGSSAAPRPARHVKR